MDNKVLRISGFHLILKVKRQIIRYIKYVFFPQLGSFLRKINIKNIRLDGPEFIYSTRSQRKKWQKKFNKVNSIYLNSLEPNEDLMIPHQNWHIMTFVDILLGIDSNQIGCILEAGCFKGVSAAKFSLVSKVLGRELHLFDSFEGLPKNEEMHKFSIKGHNIEGWFDEGKYYGSYERVLKTLKICGEPEVCYFHKGWFEDTMPKFKEPVVAAYLDCDLAVSTKTCLLYIYPLLVPGGFIVSQDGDFPLVIDVINDSNLWEEILMTNKTEMPIIRGLGTSKMVIIQKPGF